MLRLDHPLTPWLASILSGVLLALCYPNWDHNALLWIWQAPLLTVLWFRPPRQERRWLWHAPLTSIPLILYGLLSFQFRWAWQRPTLDLLRWYHDIPERYRWLYGAKWGFLTGLTFFLINLQWLRHVTVPGWIVFCLYLALYFAAFGAFAATAGRLRRDKILPEDKPAAPSNVRSEKLRNLITKKEKQTLLGPSFHTLGIAFLNSAAWVSLEWLRSVVFTGFGWNGLGVALHNEPNLTQIADVVGVKGLSFLPVFCTCVGVSTIARFAGELGRGRLRPHLDFAVAMVLLIGVFFYGLHSPRFHPLNDPVELKMVLVQGNIPNEMRWDDDQADEIYDLYENYTTLYTSQGDYDLVVWPETCLPYPFFYPPTQKFLNRVLAQGDFAVITGCDEFIPEDEFYNSMFLMRNSTKNYQVYRKQHLVPFGEYIPFRGEFPPFQWLLGKLVPDDFDAGSGYDQLHLEEPDVDIIPCICFEDTIGRKLRKFVGTGPEFILNVTNDAWFKESEASMQQMVNAKFRCIELKRPMARSANTGVTCVIDRFGTLQDPDSSDPRDKRILRDIQTGSTFISGVLPVTLQIDSKPSQTIYARYGDWFSYVMMTVAALAISLAAFIARRAASRYARMSSTTRP